MPNGVTYEVENLTNGIRKEVNRSNLKLFDLPSESPPALASIPRCLLGVPQALENTTMSTRELESLRADLPRVAEPPLRPLSEGIPPAAAHDIVLPYSTVTGQRREEESVQRLQRGGSVCSDTIGDRRDAVGGQELMGHLGTRPLRATLSRRARVGDPSAGYDFPTLHSLG